MTGKGRIISCGHQQSKSVRKPIRLGPKENSHYLKITPLLYFVLHNGSSFVAEWLTHLEQVSVKHFPCNEGLVNRCSFVLSIWVWHVAGWSLEWNGIATGCAQNCIAVNAPKLIIYHGII